MATDKPIDDLFRAALVGVDPPQPPAADKGAWARAAKTGARTKARETAWSRFWKGVGMALLLLLAFFTFRDPASEQAQVQLPVDGAVGSTEADAHADAVDKSQPTRSEAREEDGDSSPGVSHDLTNSQLRQAKTNAIEAPAQDVAGRSASQPTSFGMEPIAGAVDGPGEVSAIREHTANPADPGVTSNNVHAPSFGYTPYEPLVPPSAITDPVDTVHIGTERSSIPPLEVRALDRPALIVSLSSTSTGVDGAVPDPPFVRFTLSPWASLDNTRYVDDRAGSDSALEQLNAGRALTGTAGVRLRYALDRHWGVMTGVQYSRKGAVQGVVSTSATSTSTYQLSGAYYEVPLAFQYSVPLEGKEFYARLGMSFQFNARSGRDKVMMQDEDVQELTTLQLSSGSVGGTVDLAIGLGFRLGKGVGFFVEPAYRFGLSPMVKHPTFDGLPFNPKVNSLCLGMGLSFQLPH